MAYCVILIFQSQGNVVVHGYSPLVLAMATSEELEVTGVIFQYSPEAVLFEFSLAGSQEDVQIGMVRPSGLKVANK